ncbi:aldose 1-epimerase [Bacteroidia bacterium]|nr:aldose 1-epimerase [Bacteroidia bacterium]GHV45474.1 aldose 1-epimerase [Bacteroidia bacterium]
MENPDFIEIDGKHVSFYTLVNALGMSMDITNYGAKIVSIMAPDRDGKFDDVVLGFDTLDEYLMHEPFFGAVCGRFANRIKGGKFTLDGKEFTLAINNASNALHGGIKGFNAQIWNVARVEENKLTLHYLARDGEEGYPGNLNITVTYELTDDNALKIHYEATTDQPTVVNLCNHSYFALQGAGNGTVRHQILQLNADFHTVMDSETCPAGEIAAVDDTVYDFRTPATIETRIDKPEFARFGGLDNNWIIRKNQAGDLASAGYVFDNQTGRKLEVFTTQPGIQVYTGNWIERLRGKNGKIHEPQGAICLEAQGFPAAANFAHFPSPVLRPNEKYDEWCVYKFSVEK